jgi:hypothetical protein
MRKACLALDYTASFIQHELTQLVAHIDADRRAPVSLVVVFATLSPGWPPLQWSGFLREVPGHVHRGNVVIALHQQPRFQQGGALGMQEIVIPTVFHQFGDDNYDAAGGLFF